MCEVCPRVGGRRGGYQSWRERERSVTIGRLGYYNGYHGYRGYHGYWTVTKVTTNHVLMLRLAYEADSKEDIMKYEGVTMVTILLQVI